MTLLDKLIHIHTDIFSINEKRHKETKQKNESQVKQICKGVCRIEFIIQIKPKRNISQDT